MILFLKHIITLDCLLTIVELSEKNILLRIKLNKFMKKIIPCILLSLFAQVTHSHNNTYNLLIGTYTNSGNSEGIYSYALDISKGEFRQNKVTKNIINPSYLTISENKRCVYAVSETDTRSAALSFSFDRRKGTLVKLNSSDTEGESPCYILATDKYVFTANYGGGSISVFGRNKDGSLTKVKQLIRHAGKSIHPTRQDSPHVHQIIISPDKKFVLANDLGTDQLTAYSYNPTSEKKILTIKDTLTVKLGSGPRHAVFSKDGKKIYVVQELDGTVTVVDFKKGNLSILQETTVVCDENSMISAADIHLSPNGKFLYVTNRGDHNNITCFSIDKNGKLALIQQISTRGNSPRNFALTPDGNYLLVAHQKSNDIMIFSINNTTGMLTYTGKSFKVESPVCLVFY